jgi:hypothetical protein
MRDVREVLKAHAPSSDWDADLGLKNTLVEMLLDLADSGVTDPQELRAKMLENFTFEPLQ